MMAGTQQRNILYRLGLYIILLLLTSTLFSGRKCVATFLHPQRNETVSFFRLQQEMPHSIYGHNF